MNFSNKYFLFCVVHYVGVILGFKLLHFTLPSLNISIFENLVNLIVTLFFSYYLFGYTKRNFLNGKLCAHGKAVLVTGCSSGFGYNIAKRLDDLGFHVFASCRNPSCEGAQELKSICSNRLQIVKLDVTQDESVKEAAKFVTCNLGDSVFWAVVNNAGIQKGFIFDFTTIDDFKDSMETNGFGMIRVIKAFLPLLKKSRGRIINITSMFGRLSAPIASAYIMSKRAAAGFSDALRQEISVWGIRVIQVEPDLFETKIIDCDRIRQNFNADISRGSPDLRKEYGEEYFKRFLASVEYFTSLSSSNINRVADACESAICSEYPDTIYRIGRNEFCSIIFSLFSILPTRLQDYMMKILHYNFLLYPKPK